MKTVLRMKQLLGNGTIHRHIVKVILLLLMCNIATTLYAQSPFLSSKQSILLSNAQSGASERWAAIFFPSTATANYRLILPNIAPTIGQVLNVASISSNDATLQWTDISGSAWSLSGNAPTASWNGTTGSFLGTTNAQPLSIATTNATAQDIRFFTGANGVSERMRITGTGNVGIGTDVSTPITRLEVKDGSIAITNSDNTARELRLYEPSSSGTNFTAFRTKSQTGNIIYTLPDADGLINGDVLTTDGAGNLRWSTVGNSTRLNNISSADGSSNINHGNYFQQWRWDGLTSNTALTLSSASTLATSNSQTILSVAMSGANATSTQTTYGAQISNTHTGTSSTNVGLSVSASGGTNNYGLLVPNGRVGIGTTSPSSILHIVGGGIIASTSSDPANPLSNSYNDFAAANGTNEIVGIRVVNTSPIAANNVALIGFNSYNGGGASWGIGSIQNSTTWADNDLFFGYSNGGSYLKRFYFKNNGSLGIGTTTPTNNIDVAGRGAIGAGYAGIVTAPSNGLIVQGNVGIGISSPAVQLHVNGTSRFSGGNLLIDTSAVNTAGQLQLMNPARTFQTNLRAGAQTANITYTLPTTAPTAGQVLSSDASGNMSWATALTGTSGWSTTGNASTSPSTNYLGTSDAQDLVIRTNAVERARFANGNTLNFGIQGSGATIPPASFTIGSAGWVSSSTSNNQAGTHTIIQAGPGTGIGSPGYISMRVPATGSSGTAVQSSSEMMRINGTGVLIGGASGTMPNYRLQVDANSGGQAYANFTTGSGSGTASSDGLIVGLQNDNTNALVWNQENGYVRFGTNNTERVRIDNAGNVGIGVTSPTYRLDVSGGDFRLVNNSSYLRTWGECDIEYDGGADGLMAFRNNANSNGKTRFWNASSVSLLTIQNNGNIGINTESPSQMLHTMNGNILIDNNDNTARELRFDEPSGSGTNYTAFRAQAQASNITYTLPATDGTSGSTLTTNGSGLLSWSAIGNTTFVRKTIDESIANTTTMQDDDDLDFAVGANQTWEVEFMLRATGGGGDIKFAINLPTSASMWFTARGDDQSSSQDDYVEMVIPGTEYNFTTGGNWELNPSGAIIHLKGIVVTGGTAGTIQLRWTQRVSNSTSTVVKAFSYMKATRMQ